MLFNRISTAFIASSKVKAIRLCRGHVLKKNCYLTHLDKIIKYTSLGKIKRYDLKNFKKNIFDTFL